MYISHTFLGKKVHENNINFTIIYFINNKYLNGEKLDGVKDFDLDLEPNEECRKHSPR